MNIKTILMILAIVTLSSCSEKVNCSGVNEKKLFFDLLSENFEKKYDEHSNNKNSDFNFNLNYQDVKQSFFEDAIKMEAIRPTKIEKELKRCECESQITFSYPSEMSDAVYNNVTPHYEIKTSELYKDIEYENITYSLQLTEDNLIYCETINVDVLAEAFYDYAFLKNLLYNIDNKKYIKALKNYLINDWEQQKSNQSNDDIVIGEIIFDNNMLRIEDVDGIWLSVYDFNDISVSKSYDNNKSEVIKVNITNQGGGAGGNIGISEDYLLTKINSSQYNIELSKEEVIRAEY